MKLIVKRKVLFWYVTLEAANGQTLMTSETYFSKNNALRAGRHLRKKLKIEVYCNDDKVS